MRRRRCVALQPEAERGGIDPAPSVRGLRANRGWCVPVKDTVCVTGGSGGIGQALLDRLLDVYDVKVLFRTKTDVTRKWEERGCTPVWGDLSNDGALADLVAGAKFVFHAAALVGG